MNKVWIILWGYAALTNIRFILSWTDWRWNTWGHLFPLSDVLSCQQLQDMTWLRRLRRAYKDKQLMVQRLIRCLPTNLFVSHLKLIEASAGFMPKSSFRFCAFTSMLQKAGNMGMHWKQIPWKHTLMCSTFVASASSIIASQYGRTFTNWQWKDLRKLKFLHPFPWFVLITLAVHHAFSPLKPTPSIEGGSKANSRFSWASAWFLFHSISP